MTQTQLAVWLNNHANILVTRIGRNEHLVSSASKRVGASKTSKKKRHIDVKGIPKRLRGDRTALAIMPAVREMRERNYFPRSPVKLAEPGIERGQANSGG